MQKIADGKLTSLDAKVCQVLFPFNLLTREGGERRIEEEVGEEVEKEEEEKKEEGCCRLFSNCLRPPYLKRRSGQRDKRQLASATIL